MERKIGEIFEFGGEWYQCLESVGCSYCDFYELINCSRKLNVRGECINRLRSDGKPVVFKKLEKVGEPYEYFIRGMGVVIVQEYVLANSNYIWEYNQDVVVMDCQNGKVAIQIKQNKEDMEEKKGYESKLKTFNLELAKQGKPVCTRDGRKARIICFDGKGDQPIIALVEAKGNKDALIEKVERYFINGHSVFEVRETNNDLMMLPEKKEGWIIVSKNATIYDSLEKAKESFDSDKELCVCKAEWEE